MRKLLIVLLLLLGVSCSETDTAGTPEEAPVHRAASPLVGTWILTEQKVSIGGPATWQAVESGDTIRFMADGSFAWKNRDCHPTFYQRKGDLIELAYDCPEDSEYANQPSYSDSINYRVVAFTSSHLTITPATFTCVEECLYKYARVDEAEQ